MNEQQSLLQRFFDASLIPSETTDERLKHYQTAAADLAKRFEEKPQDAVSACRVAIDPNCPASDPWFNEVQEAVKVHWKTFLIKNHDAPRQICRAILLEALSKVAAAGWVPTLAIWNAASNLLPHMGDGPEQSITREFIIGLAIECESYSSEKWQASAISPKDLPEFEVEVPAIKIAEVDEPKLFKAIAAASGPHDEQGQAYPKANQHFPNSGQHWSYQFAPKVAKAIATAVNSTLTETVPAIDGLNKNLAPSLKKHASALGKWVIKLGQQNARFTALLWWKQALYSPTLEQSYRELSPAGTAIALSFDLSTVAGAPVPLSVEYFLRETIRNLVPENPKLTLMELIAATKAVDVLASCLPTPPSGSPHRISLREFLSVVRQGTPAEDMFSSYVGIVATTSLPLSEWAVWLLRERLVEILTVSKA